MPFEQQYQKADDPILCTYCEEVEVPDGKGHACCDDHEDEIFCSEECAIDYHGYLEGRYEDMIDDQAKALYYHEKYGDPL